MNRLTDRGTVDRGNYYCTTGVPTVCRARAFGYFWPRKFRTRNDDFFFLKSKSTQRARTTTGEVTADGETCRERRN